MKINHIMSPFRSAAAAVFFLKRSCSRLITKKNSILFTGSHLFSELETQYLQSKNCLLFLHCSRDCTVQWTVQLTWTVQNDALFMNSARNYTVHVKNSEQCNSLALFSCTAWTFFFFFKCVKFFFVIFKKKKLV